LPNGTVRDSFPARYGQQFPALPFFSTETVPEIMPAFSILESGNEVQQHTASVPKAGSLRSSRSNKINQLRAKMQGVCPAENMSNDLFSIIYAQKP